MASYIPKDFQPRPEDYQAQGVSQIPRDFLDVVVTPEFVEYWTELRDRGLKKGKKDAWYTTWRNRARFLWAKRGPAWEENRHKYRQAGGERKDLFDTMLDRIHGKGGEGDRGQTKQTPGGANPSGAILDKINGSAKTVAHNRPARERNLPAAAAPINGSAIHGRSKTEGSEAPRSPAAAAPMDPLEALKEMQKIIESA